MVHTNGGGGGPPVQIPVSFPPGTGPSAFAQAKKDADALRKTVDDIKAAMAEIHGFRLPGGRGGGSGGAPSGGGKSPVEKTWEGISKNAKEVERSASQHVRHARELHSLYFAISTLMAKPIAHYTGIPGGTREVMTLGRLMLFGGRAAMAGGAGAGGIVPPNPNAPFQSIAGPMGAAAARSSVGPILSAGLWPRGGMQAAANMTATNVVGAGGGAGVAGYGIGTMFGVPALLAGGWLGGAAAATPQGAQMMANTFKPSAPGARRGFLNEWTKNIIDPFGISAGARKSVDDFSDWTSGRVLGKAGRDWTDSEQQLRRAEIGRAAMLAGQRQFGSESSTDSTLWQTGADARLQMRHRAGRLSTETEAQFLNRQLRDQEAHANAINGQAWRLENRAQGISSGRITPQPGENASALEGQAAELRVRGAQQMIDLEGRRIQVAEKLVDIEQRRVNTAQNLVEDAQNKRLGLSEQLAFGTRRDGARMDAAVKAVMEGTATPKQLQMAGSFANALPDGAPFQRQYRDQVNSLAGKNAPFVSEFTKLAEDYAKTLAEAAKAAFSGKNEAADALKEKFVEINKAIDEGAPKLGDQLSQALVHAMRRALAEAATKVGNVPNTAE